MQIAILGKGESRREACAKGWECWGLATDPSTDDLCRVFEMHRDERWKQWPGHFQKLAGFGQRLVIREQHKDLSHARTYPTAAKTVDYFTNSVCYMIALAVMYQPRVIGLWGCDLNHLDLSEHVKQMRCTEFWLGVAVGRGIRVVLPQGSKLLAGSYG